MGQKDCKIWDMKMNNIICIEGVVKNSVGRGSRGNNRRQWHKYDHNTLYVCIKLSKIK